MVQPVNNKIEDDVSFELGDLFIFLWQKKFRIVITTMILAFFAAQVILSLPKYYTAYSTLLLGGKSNSLNLPSSVASFAGGVNDNAMDTFIEFMRSRQFAKDIVEQEALTQLAEFQAPVHAVIDDPTDYAVSVFQRNVTYGQLGDTDLLRVSYTSISQETAARVANRIGPAFFAFHTQMSRRRADDASVWLNSQLSQLQGRLADAEEALQLFLSEKKLVDIKSQIDIVRTEISSLLNEKLMTERALAEVNNTYRSVQATDKSLNSLMEIQWLMQNPLIVDIRSRISAQEQLLEQISKRYKFKHPKYIATQSKLDTLKQEQQTLVDRLVASLENDYHNLRQRKAQLEGNIDVIKQQHSVLGQHELQLARLKREVESTQSMYESFLAKLQETEIMKDLGNQDEFAVVDYASKPQYPSKPKVSLLIIMAVTFSFMLSTGFWFVLHLISDKATRLRNLMRKLQIPILAEMPKLTSGQSSKAMQSVLKNEQGNYLFSESIRTLRTSTMVHQDEQEKRVIVITSVGPAEGKSTLAINLAASFGRLEKTLLLDVDLRNPKIASAFDLETGHPGIMDLVNRQCKFGDCLHRRPNSQMLVVPGGTPPSDPIAVISKPRFASMLQKLSVLYERVIIDAPAVSSFSDALILSKYADAVILVCDVEKVDNEQLLRAIQKFHDSGVPLMGVVLNKVRNLRNSLEKRSRLHRAMRKVTGG